jgi:hypothetical protein
VLPLACSRLTAQNALLFAKPLPSLDARVVARGLQCVCACFGLVFAGGGSSINVGGALKVEHEIVTTHRQTAVWPLGRTNPRFVRVMAWARESSWESMCRRTANAVETAELIRPEIAVDTEQGTYLGEAQVVQAPQHVLRPRRLGSGCARQLLGQRVHLRNANVRGAQSVGAVESGCLHSPGSLSARRYASGRAALSTARHSRHLDGWRWHVECACVSPSLQVPADASDHSASGRSRRTAWQRRLSDPSKLRDAIDNRQTGARRPGTMKAPGPSVVGLPVVDGQYATRGTTPTVVCWTTPHVPHCAVGRSAESNLRRS